MLLASCLLSYNVHETPRMFILEAICKPYILNIFITTQFSWRLAQLYLEKKNYTNQNFIFMSWIVIQIFFVIQILNNILNDFDANQL